MDWDKLLQVRNASSIKEALSAPFHLHAHWKEEACRLSVVSVR